MKLPHITPKQQTILTLLYKHRFLTRKHIQLFLGHTDKSRTIRWLKELREKQYIDWLYEADNLAVIPDSVPAIYFLSVNGIRWLRQNGYSKEALRKRYKDNSRSQGYIDRCLLLASCCLNMEAKMVSDQSLTYRYFTEADYASPDNDYHFLAGSEVVRPQLCYAKEKRSGKKVVVDENLLEIIDITLPRYSLRHKLKNYVAFLANGEEWELEGDLPIIKIACPTKETMIYAKRTIRRLLAEALDDEDEEQWPADIQFQVTTVEQLKRHGITGKIWELA